MPTEPSKKRKEPEPVEAPMTERAGYLPCQTGLRKNKRDKLFAEWIWQDLGLGGLYDFLPPPDPEKDKARAAQLLRLFKLAVWPTSERESARLRL